MKTTNNYFENDGETRARQVVQGAIRAAVGDGSGAETVRGWCDVALAAARDDESSQKKPAPPSEGGASSRGRHDRDSRRAQEPNPASLVVDDLDEVYQENVPHIQAALRNGIKRLCLATQEGNPVDVEVMADVALELGSVLHDIDEVERVVRRLLDVAKEGGEA